MSDTIMGVFYRDSLRAERFQTLITSLFESICLSDLIGGLSESRGSLLVNLASTSRDNKVKADKDHGKKFQCKLTASLTVFFILGNTHPIWLISIFF